jgi:uncharacterized protein with HEPN domain
MKRTITLYLNDILEAVSMIEEYTRGLDKSNFEKDRKVQDAVVRRFEIIGEATKNIPNTFRMKYPEIPWRDLAGFRDVLIHGYFGVDVNRVWGVIEDYLPKLKSQLAEIMESM